MRFGELAVCGLLCLSCSAAPSQPQEEPKGAADSSAGGSSAFEELAPGADADCTQGTRLEGEFFVLCPDASAPVQMCTTHLNEAGEEVCIDAGGAAPAPAQDASPPPPPPPPPPPTEPDEGPCAVLDEKTCQDAFFETDPLAASCSISGDTVRLSLRQCEVCNLAGTRNQYAMIIKACGGCEQVFSAGYADDRWFGALECDEFSMTESLENTQSDKSCIDVYVNVGTSGTDNVTDGIHTIRTCRCDRTTEKCVVCVNGACTGWP